MKASIKAGLVALIAVVSTAGASAESITVLTYNLGLLKAFGSNFVPMVDARSKAAPAVIAADLAETNPQIALLEEVWDDAAAAAISKEAAALGYAAARPAVKGALTGLGSGMLLLVKPPWKITEWAFERFTRNTFMDGFVRKGIIQATLESADTGRRIALVGLHTVAIDTKDNEPFDKKQIEVFTAQTAQILAALKARSADVPSLLLGDFNVGPGYADALYRGFADVRTLREAGAVLFPGAPLITWDPGNPLIKYGNYPNEPPAKIDHVFLQDGPDAQWKVNAARAMFADPVEGLSLVPKKDALKKSTETAAVACPLSDHYGFVAELELP